MDGVQFYGPGGVTGSDIISELVYGLSVSVDALKAGAGQLSVVKAVATTAPALSGLPVIDGYQTVADDVVLLTAQASPADNGLWSTFPGAWDRPKDFATGQIVTSRTAVASAGTVNAGTMWALQVAASVVVGTTAQTWVNAPVAGLTAALAAKLPKTSAPISLRDYFSPLALWATGAQFQAAINDAAAAGRPLDCTGNPGQKIADLGAGSAAVVLSIPNGTEILSNGAVVESAASGFPNSAFGAYAFMRNAGWATGNYLTTANASSDIHIRGLWFRRTVDMAGTEGPYDGAVAIRYATRNVVVEDCVFEGAATAVIMEGGVDFAVRNCLAYSQSDAAFRVVNGNGTTTGASRAQKGVLSGCWSVNVGTKLDGVTQVPNPSGPLGSAFVVHQPGSRVENCGAVNPWYNAFETGGSVRGIGIDGFKVHVDIAGRTGNILLADCGDFSVANVDIQIHNGATATVNIAGTIGSGNGIGQQDLMLSGIRGYNSYSAAGFYPVLIAMAGDCSNITIEGVSARGMGLNLLPNATSTGNTVHGANIRQAAQAGLYVAKGLNWTIRNVRAIDCGADTTQADSVRVGIVLDQLGAGALVTDNRSDGARYAYYVNAGATINWDRNFGTGAVGTLLTTNNPVLVRPGWVSQQEIVAPDLSASGLTGATAGGRFVGATAAGAPVAGTFAVRDFVVDANGVVWVCTVAGTPGTWVNAATPAGTFELVGWNRFVPAVIGADYSGEPFAGGTRTTGQVFGQLVVAPLYSGPTAVTISSLSVNVATAAAGALYRMGLWTVTNQANPYAWAPAKWADLLVDAGTVDCSTTGNKVLALGVAQVIPANTWFAVGGVQQGSAGAAQTVGNTPGIGAFTPFGITAAGAGIVGSAAIGLSMAGVSGALGNVTPGAAVAVGHGVGFHRSA